VELIIIQLECHSNYLSTQLKQKFSIRGFKTGSKGAIEVKNTKVKMLKFKESFVVEIKE
jgi:hypothetical protein